MQRHQKNMCTLVGKTGICNLGRSFFLCMQIILFVVALCTLSPNDYGRVAKYTSATGGRRFRYIPAVDIKGGSDEVTVPLYPVLRTIVARVSTADESCNLSRKHSRSTLKDYELIDNTRK